MRMTGIRVWTAKAETSNERNIYMLMWSFRLNVYLLLYFILCTSKPKKISKHKWENMIYINESNQIRNSSWMKKYFVLIIILIKLFWKISFFQYTSKTFDAYPLPLQFWLLFDMMAIKSCSIVFCLPFRLYRI